VFFPEGADLDEYNHAQFEWETLRSEIRHVSDVAEWKLRGSDRPI
jgi:hypothetical protein